MTSRIKLEPRAAAETEAARTWWLDNRPTVRGAFDEELDQAFDLIRTLPQAGQPVADPDTPDLRRVFLPRVRYHLYYRVFDEDVQVLALWHASRGSGPDVRQP